MFAVLYNSKHNSVQLTNFWRNNFFYIQCSAILGEKEIKMHNALVKCSLNKYLIDRLMGMCNYDLNLI